MDSPDVNLSYGAYCTGKHNTVEVKSSKVKSMGLREKFQKIPLKGGASGGRWGKGTKGREWGGGERVHGEGSGEMGGDGEGGAWGRGA